MKSGPQESFAASGVSGAIARQNGAGSSSSRSSARSATMRRKIPVEVGQVACAPCSRANPARSAAMSTMQRGGIWRMRASTSAGVATNSVWPGRRPAKGLSSTTTCAGFAPWYFCSQLFGIRRPRFVQWASRRACHGAASHQGRCA
jgi:hypothetical protein